VNLRPSWRLSADPTLSTCYRDRVAAWSRQWFSAEARPQVERGLLELIRREWTVLLKRLSSLLQIDDLEPAGT